MIFRLFCFFILTFTQNMLFSIEYGSNPAHVSVQHVTDVRQESNPMMNFYYYLISLENGHVLTEGLKDKDQSSKYSVGMPMQLIETPNVGLPGYSEFTYTSLDGSIQKKKRSPTINADWHPDESVEIVGVTDTRMFDGGRYQAPVCMVIFSNGTMIKCEDGPFNAGDLFFQVYYSDHRTFSLVNLANGDVTTTGFNLGGNGWVKKRNVKVTW